MGFFRLLRPHQYIKNLFVFAPVFFSFNLDIYIIFKTFIVFALFSLLASSIYIINDIKDLEEDRKHPVKKHRPIASGIIKPFTAALTSITLALTAFISAFFLSSNLLLVFLIYFVLNIAYSFKLKHIAIVDIAIIATGFVLRLYAGNSVTDIELSKWIIVVTFLLALFLAVAKRRDDVLLSTRGHQTRKNIDGYNLEFVNATMVLMSGVVIVAYLLYSVSPSVIERLGTDNLFITTFFVVLGIMRYMQITFVEQNSGSPTRIVIKDRFLQVTIFLWITLFFVLVKLV
ncbi:decaprenyl-phosphate phosphoribosyltransferase [Limisalsivibrio acetivorans]|uniref:decaprenyl-phosphate phosphoribosyltransferase n=1 Tax=Limisalsivibrio acetivorans TaxID=1304888 RepID=UPI0003B5E60A|nr:decaprenyl-phosphate phosphoribosyltransferase [Limisalsivibrio acetivorans]